MRKFWLLGAFLLLWGVGVVTASVFLTDALVRGVDVTRNLSRDEIEVLEGEVQRIDGLGNVSVRSVRLVGESDVLLVLDVGVGKVVTSRLRWENRSGVRLGGEGVVVRD